MSKIYFPKRNHMNNIKNLKLNKNKKYIQYIHYKPNGFWYSCYKSWYNWNNVEKFRKYKYIHKININKNMLTDINNKDKDKLLVIKNIKDFDIFNKRYHSIYINKELKIKWDFINWIKVSNDYGGIEICPYINERRDIFWYESFDVASGCIWNIESIIKDTNLLITI